MWPESLSVDLGTSHTVAVLRGRDGEVNPLLFDGSPLLVSAVFAGTDGALSVGRDAMYSARLAPERFEPHPKRRIDDSVVLLGDTEVNVQDMFTAILARVRAESVRVTGTVPALTLTHPATWGPVRRQILIDAADAAGMPTPQLVVEPVAAASYFSRRQTTDIPVGSVIVVYDLGGGTFDITVVQRHSTGFEVLAADGAADLGGVDIDHALVKHLGQQHQDDPQWSLVLDPQTADHRRQRRHFFDDVRSAKERLSRDTYVDLLIPLVEKEVHLTRNELEALARPLLDQTVRLTQTLIRAAGKTPADISGLFLVGGASRMPLAATLLHQATGIAPTAIDQPETVVANGALSDGDPQVQTPTANPVPKQHSPAVPDVHTESPRIEPPKVDLPPKQDPPRPQTTSRVDMPEAEKWFRKAADAGNGDAMNDLGHLLERRGNFSEAESWYRKGSEAGNAQATCNVGVLLRNRGDRAEAEKWFRKAADAGNGNAMNGLGHLLEDRGDLAGAEPLYRKGADVGNGRAMCSLGYLLEMRGDLSEAESWYRKGAEAGNAQSICNVAGLLRDRGDRAEAETWFRRAVELGNANAMYGLGRMLEERGDLAGAESWYRKGADAGNASAMCNLGFLTEKRGDLAGAESWYRKGADAGNAQATCNVGGLLKNRGELAEAEKWFRKAVELGNANAMNRLGLLMKDRGSLADAEFWYRKGADAGNADAMNNLGRLLQA